MNPFQDQKTFMLACGQTANRFNREQVDLYYDLIKEESKELHQALIHTADELDAIIDTIVVLIGYGLSCGYDMESAWREVMRSNMAKIDPVTGMVIRREDGKILKPEGWTPPDLEPFTQPDAQAYHGA